MTRENASSVIVRAGEWDISETDNLYPSYDRKVKEFVSHEGYTRGGWHNDISLLFLEEPMPTNLYINVACLPPQNFNFDGNICTASGWGKKFIEDQAHQEILKKVDLPIVSHSECENIFRRVVGISNFKLDKSFICAGGEKGKDT